MPPLPSTPRTSSLAIAIPGAFATPGAFPFPLAFALPVGFAIPAALGAGLPPTVMPMSLLTLPFPLLVLRPGLLLAIVAVPPDTRVRRRKPRGAQVAQAPGRLGE
jgi:hypothetical protein